jgi:hypothetical protein
VKTWRFEIALGAFAASLLAGAGLRTSRFLPAPADPPLTHPSPLVTRRVHDVGAIEDAIDNTISGDPFRISNTPPATAFSAARQVSAAQPGLPPAPRPSLVLKAIVGGPPWQAVVEGLPGQPGATVVTTGSRFDRLTIRSVGRDTVVVAAPDTTWKLTFQRPEL